jgi:hypothetical protein
VYPQLTAAASNENIRLFWFTRCSNHNNNYWWKSTIYICSKEAEHKCEYTSAGTTFTTSVIPMPMHTFVITDANGCTTTIATTVSPITDPTVTATQVNVVVTQDQMVQ